MERRTRSKLYSNIIAKPLPIFEHTVDAIASQWRLARRNVEHQLNVDLGSSRGGFLGHITVDYGRQLAGRMSNV